MVDTKQANVMIKSEIQNVILNGLVWTAAATTPVGDLRSRAATMTNIIWEVVHKADNDTST